MGLGFPIVAIPAIAYGYGLDTAVVVSVLPTIAIDVVNLATTRAERHDSSGLKVFAAVGIVGAVFGSLVRTDIDERILTLVLAVTLTLYLLSELMPQVDLRDAAQKPAVGGAAGGLSGLLQATIGVSGPIVGIYFLNRTDTRRQFIFHITAVFVIMGSTRLLMLIVEGAFGAARTAAAFALAGGALVLRTVGFRLGERLPQALFRRIVLSLMTLSLVPLLIRTF